MTSWVGDPTGSGVASALLSCAQCTAGLPGVEAGGSAAPSWGPVRVGGSALRGLLLENCPWRECPGATFFQHAMVIDSRNSSILPRRGALLKVNQVLSFHCGLSGRGPVGCGVMQSSHILIFSFSFNGVRESDGWRRGAVVERCLAFEAWVPPAPRNQSPSRIACSQGPGPSTAALHSSFLFPPRSGAGTGPQGLWCVT